MDNCPFDINRPENYPCVKGDCDCEKCVYDEEVEDD
jgi:hypothetical protein